MPAEQSMQLDWLLNFGSSAPHLEIERLAAVPDLQHIAN
jgi:hypothetical protein